MKLVNIALTWACAGPAWACKSPSTATTEERGVVGWNNGGCKAIEIARPWSPWRPRSPLSRLSFVSSRRRLGERRLPSLPPSLREVLADDEGRRPLPRLLCRRVYTRYAYAPLPFPSRYAEPSIPNPNASYLYSDLAQFRVYAWCLLTSSFWQIVLSIHVLYWVRPQRNCDSGAVNFRFFFQFNPPCCMPSLPWPSCWLCLVARVTHQELGFCPGGT
jgi:hypothetical protein